jgi:hypothetical protein
LSSTVPSGPPSPLNRVAGCGLTAADAEWSPVAYFVYGEQVKHFQEAATPRPPPPLHGREAQGLPGRVSKADAGPSRAQSGGAEALGESKAGHCPAGRPGSLELGDNHLK